MTQLLRPGKALRGLGHAPGPQHTTAADHTTAPARSQFPSQESPAFPTAGAGPAAHAGRGAFWEGRGRLGSVVRGPSSAEAALARSAPGTCESRRFRRPEPSRIGPRTRRCRPPRCESQRAQLRASGRRSAAAGTAQPRHLLPREPRPPGAGTLARTSQHSNAIGPFCHVTSSDSPGWLQPRTAVTGATEGAGTPAGWDCGARGAGGPGRAGERGAGGTAAGLPSRRAAGPLGCARHRGVGCRWEPGGPKMRAPARELFRDSAFPASDSSIFSSFSTPLVQFREEITWRRPQVGRGARGSRAGSLGAASCCGASGAAGIRRGWAQSSRQGLLLLLLFSRVGSHAASHPTPAVLDPGSRPLPA